MGNMSLQDVMNKVACQLDAMQPHPINKTRNILSELEIFASLDPLLGDLQRQYKDARYARRMQEKMFGPDDPMADVARDSEDSAWCAMQTRYTEMRADRDMMRDVQMIQNEQREEQRREREANDNRARLDTYYQADMMARMKKQQTKSSSILEWLFVLWLMNRVGQPFSIAPGFTRFAA